MFDGLTDRQRALIDAVLVLAVIALSFIVLGYVASVFYAFVDILLLFFLAWLLSFALLPLINGLTRLIPRLTQAGAVIVVYLAIVVVLLAILVQASAALASSINQFILDAPNLEDQLTNFLTQLQDATRRARVPGRPRGAGPADRRQPAALCRRSSSGRSSRSPSRASASSAAS